MPQAGFIANVILRPFGESAIKMHVDVKLKAHQISLFALVLKGIPMSCRISTILGEAGQEPAAVCGGSHIGCGGYNIIALSCIDHLHVGYRGFYNLISIRVLMT